MVNEQEENSQIIRLEDYLSKRGVVLTRFKPNLTAPISKPIKPIMYYQGKIYVNGVCLDGGDI